MTDQISIGGVCRLADRGVIRAARRRRRDLPPGPAHQRRRGLDADAGATWPASARRRGGCRRASSSGGRPTTSSCWRARPASRADAEAAVDVRAARQVQAQRCERRDGAVRASPVRPRRRCWAMPLPGNDAPHARRPAIRLPDAAGMARALLAAPRRRRGRRRRCAALPLATWRWLEVRAACHDRGGDGRPLRAADGQLRARRRRRLPEGLLPRAGGRRAQPVPRHDQAPHAALRLRLGADRGQDVFVAGAVNEPAGTVANAAPHPEQRGGSALVEVRLAALGADLRLGGADGPPLRQRPLPYPVPLDVTAPA